MFENKEQDIIYLIDLITHKEAYQWYSVTSPCSVLSHIDFGMQIINIYVYQKMIIFRLINKMVDMIETMQVSVNQEKVAARDEKKANSE